MIKPEYAENIIVGIVNQNQFNWYILNKFICLLDLKSLSSEEFELYMKNDLCSSVRKDFITIDKNNIENFLIEINNYMTSCENLQLMILNGLKEFDNFYIDDFFPVLYFDFDKKIVYSQYPEYFDFESFLPKQWNFIYDDFSDLLKDEDKYWIYKGKNIFDASTKKIEESKKKYNQDYLFKDQTLMMNSTTSKSITSETAMVEYNETIFTKIRNWFKGLFFKN